MVRDTNYKSVSFAKEFYKHIVSILHVTSMPYEGNEHVARDNRDIFGNLRKVMIQHTSFTFSPRKHKFMRLLKASTDASNKHLNQ